MEKIKTGTTILALKCKDGIIIAGDKQVSTGFMIHGEALKVVELSKNIYLAFSGVVSDIQYIQKILKTEMELFKLRNRRDIKINEVANLLSLINYYGLRNFFPRIAGLLLAGFDEKEFYIYNITPDGVLEERKDYLAEGSGSLFAIPVLDAEYKEDLSAKEGKELVIKALNVAAKRDLYSGIGYVLYTITRKKIEKEEGKLDPYKEEKKKKVIKVN